MPDIILVIYLWTLFIHEANNGHMSVSGYTVDFNATALLAFHAILETFVLHGIRGSDHRNLDDTECHHFTSAIIHKCVSAILWINNLLKQIHRNTVH